MLFVSCWKSLWRCFVAVITVFLQKLRPDHPNAVEKQEHGSLQFCRFFDQQYQSMTYELYEFD